MKEKNQNKKKTVAIVSSIIIGLSGIGGLIYNKFKSTDETPSLTPTPTISQDITKGITPTNIPTPTQKPTPIPTNTPIPTVTDSPIITESPTVTPTNVPNSPTPIPTNSPTPKPTSKPTPTVTPQNKTLEEYYDELGEFIISNGFPSWVLRSYDDDYSYAQYKMDNPSLDWETIIFHVNMGYNYAPYTRMRNSFNPNILEYANRYSYYRPTQLPYDHQLTQLSSEYTIDNKFMQIQSEAKNELEKLIDDAKTAGHDIKVIRTLLTYDDQKQIYDQKVNELGKTTADKYFPRPAHWDHQSGFVATLNSDKLSDWEKNGKNYSLRMWLEDNAHNYGFILRYSKGDPKYTGYEHSWWDIRYITKEKAIKFKNQNFSFEEFIERNYGIYTYNWKELFQEGYNFTLSNNNIIKLESDKKISDTFMHVDKNNNQYIFDGHKLNINTQYVKVKKI